MTTDFTSTTVGCDAIDAYLNSVEQVLIAVNAPRADRLEVLRDLEAQIADMLSQLPQPVTQESVQSVIDRLESPAQFAEAYKPAAAPASGNRRADSSANYARAWRIGAISWPKLAALSCALIPLSCLLLLLIVFTDAVGAAVPVSLALVVGIIATPIALWMSLRQLRTAPSNDLIRQLIVRTATAYFVLAPWPVLTVAAIVTGGFALLPLGIAAFFYCQYLLTRHLCDRMEAVVSTTAANSDSPAPLAAAGPISFGSALSMPIA